MDMVTKLWRHAIKCTSTSATVSCLEQHKEYKFRVIAENIVGNSEPGPESEVTVTREQMPDIDYDELCKFDFLIFFLFFFFKLIILSWFHIRSWTN